MFLKRNLSSFRFFTIVLTVGRGVFHELRQGYQLAELRCMRRSVPQCEQLAVDAIRGEGSGEPHVHRNKIHDPRLLAIPRECSQL